MTYLFRSLLVAALIVSPGAYSQTDSAHTAAILRKHIDQLAAPAMQGRGYEAGGKERAADYIDNHFASLNMKPAPGMATFRQKYDFPVNTFPGQMEVSINGKSLVPGRDFLVHAASSPFSTRGKQVKTIDMRAIADMESWEQTTASFNKKYIWHLQYADSFCKKLNIRPGALAAGLPKGCFIIPEKNKQTWTVAQQLIEATVLYVNDTLVPADIGSASVTMQSQLINSRNENIIGVIPGAVRDSFIVFSAHYDHLGTMGAGIIFPGASDNASGTAMLLYLAAYYAAHPQRYTIVFIAFSGEEAGLMGSAHFVKNSPLPLENIKFLTNVDIMGDATDGITVVNATENPEAFSALTTINNQYNYLPVIKSRGKAANSDHYYFSEKGVPAFFIYTNGGKGHYHDIYDTPEEVTLRNVPGIARLLVDFAGQLQHGPK
ncbi:MAG: M28 family peptidase [Taibaiella sp.]|nr:M28 family peptidase [Taibaiella sp.]